VVLVVLVVVVGRGVVAWCGASGGGVVVLVLLVVVVGGGVELSIPIGMDNFTHHALTRRPRMRIPAVACRTRGGLVRNSMPWL
jgi:hypothetical protein